jgi:hypothetical protein
MNSPGSDFLLAGGIAAYESIVQAENSVGLYSVIFAASGLIAYRFGERVLDAG